MAPPGQPPAVQAVARTSPVAAVAFQGAFQPGAAEPLGSQVVDLPPNVRDAIKHSRNLQLCDNDAVDVLRNYEQYGFRAGQELPAKPPGARAAVCDMLQTPCRAHTRRRRGR
jgi:hypothetical protein